MKKYVKPSVEYVALTVEERFASGSCTKNNGACIVNGEIFYWA